MTEVIISGMIGGMFFMLMLIGVNIASIAHNTQKMAEIMRKQEKERNEYTM